MKWYRLRFSEEASNKLSYLKGKTGLTPNILSRIGFMMSLTDPIIPDPNDYPRNGEKEIDRQVLTGYWDPLFVSMFKERLKEDAILSSLDENDLFNYFRAHMNRGVLLLDKRVRSINDLVHLMPSDIYKEVFKEKAKDKNEN